MAEEEVQNEGTEEASGGKGKMLMLGGVAVVMLIIGVFAGPAVMNMISPPEPVEGEETEEPVQVTGPAIYQSLHPPLVVNFKDSLGDSHYMQITMEVMSRDQDVINTVRDNIPMIRNALILLYSGAVYDEVTTREGKQDMLADGLAEIRSVMAETTDEELIEAVYFTSLVIQ
ncbi:MAG: flagellar basal body-associated FliL family protein [Woeseiaceae bacterium]|nr:flagellar basal body-associated FliL family protein [Woeseiaceae bacterium]